MTNDIIIRSGFFLSILLIMMLWEVLWPKRSLSLGRSRWLGNLGVVIVSLLIVRITVPVLPVAMAELAAINNWGIMNLLSLRGWAALVSGVVLLDLIIYLQHVMFHGLPSLWKLHMMHHADHDIDATTGLRFHPIEIIFSTLIKIGAVFLLGVPATGVIAFEIILNGMAMFNHGNVRLPLQADSVLRIFLVTPDMHRVHHSVIIGETNSNFGFNLSIWDYLLGTYRAQPSAGHHNMVIGLSHLREAKWQNLLQMLVLPFTASAGAYPLSHYGRNPKG